MIQRRQMLVPVAVQELAAQIVKSLPGDACVAQGDERHHAQRGRDGLLLHDHRLHKVVHLVQRVALHARPLHLQALHERVVFHGFVHQVLGDCSMKIDTSAGHVVFHGFHKALDVRYLLVLHAPALDVLVVLLDGNGLLPELVAGAAEVEVPELAEDGVGGVEARLGGARGPRVASLRGHLHRAVGDAQHLVNQALVRELRAHGSDQVHVSVDEDEGFHLGVHRGWRLLALLPPHALHDRHHRRRRRPLGVHVGDGAEEALKVLQRARDVVVHGGVALHQTLPHPAIQLHGQDVLLERNELQRILPECDVAVHALLLQHLFAYDGAARHEEDGVLAVGSRRALVQIPSAHLRGNQRH
mmetsp:Transcript_30543/g.58826  ORF Transcript_30543/g.58826 Transcript_30543/m.58826 type:complete len:357 (+) Transcript_30543:817-1887(+)